MPREKILRPYKSNFKENDNTIIEYFVLIPSLDPAFNFITDPNLLNSIIWFSETAGISWHNGYQEVDKKSGLGLNKRLNFKFSGFCTGKSPDINIGNFKG